MSKRDGSVAIWSLLSLLAAPAVSSQAVAAKDLNSGVKAGLLPPITLKGYAHDAIHLEIDGRLDERVWAEVPSYAGLRVIEPDTLAEPMFRTEIRMFYTERGFAISFDLEQPRDTIIMRHAPRDDREISRDYVSFTLDTSGSGRYAYWMSLSIGNNQADGTFLPERRGSREWDGAWYGATHWTEQGWAAEFFIPWSQVAMPAADGVRRMGLFALRRVSHLSERWSWPALPNSQPKYMSSLQQLELRGVDPHQNWSLFPYVTTTFSKVSGGAQHRVGLDAVWRPSGYLQLAATANPDFGAVESDDVQINLTAEETFFPEKRLFFLEGQEIFNTTPRSISTNGQLFTVVNTRRIGGRPQLPKVPPDVEIPVAEAIKPSELLGAVKLTGQFGRFRYGLLSASEADTVINAKDRKLQLDGRNFGVARVLYEDDQDAAYRAIGVASSIVRQGVRTATVHAMDFHYLGLSGQWNVDGQILTSDLDEGERGYGAFADISFAPRQGLKHTFELTAFDAALDVNDFGYQRRADVREAWYRMEWVRSGLKRIRDFKISPSIRYGANGDGYRLNNVAAADVVLILNSLDSLTMSFAWYGRSYDDRNSFGNGTYEVADRKDLMVGVETDPAKPVSFRGSVRYQDEVVTGRRYAISTGLNWRLADNLGVAVESMYEETDGWLLHQEAQNFTVFDAVQWHPRLSIEYYPDATHQIRLLLQWAGVRATERAFFQLSPGSTILRQVSKPPGPTDDFSVSQLNLQLRYQWQFAPLSDLFVVYSKGDSRRQELSTLPMLFRDSWDEPLIDQLVIKVRYRFGS